MSTPTLAVNDTDSLALDAYHKPQLQSGDYEISLTQKLTANGITEKNSFAATQSFRVEGPRFQLMPGDIEAVFPPDGSLGDHSNVLPHVILSRSTLPWERSPYHSPASLQDKPAGEGDEVHDPPPWLLLLVFTEEEKPEPQVIPPGEDLQLCLDDQKKADSPVCVIDVRSEVLKPFVTSLEDLTLLAHVRRLVPSDENAAKLMSYSEQEERERAVLIANRLPEPGRTSTVHLVSVEGRYNESGPFDCGKKEQKDKIRLVSLKSWRFACISTEHTFAKMTKALHDNHSAFRIPDSGNEEANHFLNDGFIPVRHALRQGGETLSWYRGPFVPGKVNDEPPLPVNAADALLRYHPAVGMFDVSYAAAWELGRLMALQSPTFSVALYRWRRLHAQSVQFDVRLKLRLQRNAGRIYPLKRRVEGDPPVSPPPPEPVSAWLEELRNLHGVPFKYLVPDERLLPQESIRFFRLDTNWIRCLLEGACSVGSFATPRSDQHQANMKQPGSFEPPSPASGVLIRSALVSGYPGLLIDAYGEKVEQLKELRRQKLSPNILLCLFSGDVNQLNIHQKPEMLHCALTPGKRTLRNCKDKEIEIELDDKRIVPIAYLAEEMGACLAEPGKFHSGDFALQMLETAEMVSFSKEPTPAIK